MKKQIIVGLVISLIVGASSAQAGNLKMRPREPKEQGANVVGIRSVGQQGLDAKPMLTTPSCTKKVKPMKKGCSSAMSVRDMWTVRV